MNVDRREKQFHLAVATQTTGLHMKSVRLELLEAGLNVPAPHVGQCGGGAIYPVTGENKQFARAGSQTAHRHLDATAMALVQLTELAQTQSRKEAYGFLLPASLGREIDVFPQAHDEGDAFLHEPGKPVLSDEFAVADQDVDVVRTEKLDELPN
jgi:hypothetical protein